ncbi:ComEC/Rec2 family competence protein [Candidatus Gracilibacteria bacterium]|nr:ComEC/Rec2 family competence protein [Candidatus Gracilibacteria bacterium]
MSKLKKSTLTISFLLAFLAGIALANFYKIPAELLTGGILVGIALVIFAKVNPADICRVNGILLAGLLLAGVSCGMLRFQFSIHETNPQMLDFYNDIEERVELRGIIAEEPDRRMDHAKYTLAISERDGKKVEGRVLVKTQLLPEYFYGDELRLRGKLQTPFESDEFSYRDYLDRFGIRSVMYYSQIEKISEVSVNPPLKRGVNYLFSQLFAFKKKFEEKINQVFPEPHASFEAGLLIGSRRGIPEKVLENFNATGLTHIIAISGYNIALVIALITALFGSFVPRRFQFPLAVVFVATFTLLVGANPAVVRAAVMGLLAFYALTHGRQYHAGLAIMFTAAVMIFVNPKILLHDVSFQLSFAAVAGLLFVSPLLEKYFEKIPNKFAIRESLLLTLSAQITAVPLIVFYFDRLSLVSPLANILVAPAIPLAMLLGFIAVAIGAIYLPAGILIGFLAYSLLSYILWIAEWGAKLPGASVEVGFFGIVFVVVYYLGLVGFLIWKRLSIIKHA